MSPHAVQATRTIPAALSARDTTNRPRPPGSAVRRLLAAVLAVLVLTPITSAHADGQDGTRLTWSVAPASADGPDGRDRLDYLAEPGSEQHDHVVVRNLGDRPITVGLAALDARQTPDNAFELLSSDEPSSRVGAWLRLDDSEIEVPARDQVVVGFTLRLPADAEPGDHAGGIVAVSTATSSNGPDVQYRVGTRVYVRVAGPVTAALTARTTADFAAGTLLVTPGTLTVDTALANAGNVRLAPAARATVSGLFGLWSRSFPLDGVDELLPSGSATATGRLPDVPPLGPLWVSIDLSRVDSRGQEIGGEVGFDSPAVLVWAAPWAGPLGVLLVLGLGAALLLRRRVRTAGSDPLADRGPARLLDDPLPDTTTPSPDRNPHERPSRKH